MGNSSSAPISNPPPPLPFPQSNPAPRPAIPPPPVPPPTSRSPKITKEIYPRIMGITLQKFSDPFKPCSMFFYGSLMDPEVLQHVLNLPEPPTMLNGTIKGFSMKMWGIYPTIIPTEGGQISGRVWRIESKAHFERLQKYETGAYTWCFCDVEMEDGEVLKGCRTFCWSGDPNSKDLKEGTFDLVRYQKYFKPSVVRK